MPHKRIPCEHKTQGTIAKYDGALFDVIPLPSIRGTGLQVFTGLSLCAGKLLFSYLHHQTLTFNHLTSAFIRHKTSYPNQVSGLCSKRDPPVSTDHADSYVTYPSYAHKGTCPPVSTSFFPIGNIFPMILGRQYPSCTHQRWLLAGSLTYQTVA